MKLLLCLLTLALPLAGAAQTVWRCGSDGRSFSDRPCAEGQAVALADTRPVVSLPEAQVQATREIRLAQRLHRERLAQEVLQRGNGLAGIGPQADGRRAQQAHTEAQTRSPALNRPQKPRPRVQRRPEADGTWRAVVPASRRASG